MKIIALTGGIASGKTTVAAMFQKLGAAIIDADKVAHRAYRKGSPLYRNIVERYGRSILTAAGHVDRRRLGAVLFRSTKEKRWLEAQIHPETRRLIGIEIQKALRQGAALILVEAALHVETGYHRSFHGLVMVVSGERKQIERLMERETLAPHEAHRRIAVQLPEEDKIKAAEWVIDNSGSLKKTEQQVRRVFKQLLGHRR